MLVWLLKFLGLYELVIWLGSSMDASKTTGASARKLTAFSLNVAFLYLIYKYTQREEWTHFETILIIILSGISFFLLLVTVPQLLQGMRIFKGEPGTTEKTKTETTIIKEESKPNESN